MKSAISVLLTAVLLSSVATITPSLSIGPGCFHDIVAFSPCLPFVSAPPNRFTDIVPAKCCFVFSLIVNDGNDNCLCYLIRQPLLLGFPLNSTKILSLSSLCPAKNASASLESVCSGSLELPPLDNTANSDNPKPSVSVPASAHPTSRVSPPPVPTDSFNGTSSLQPPSTDGQSKEPESSEDVSHAAKRIEKSDWNALRLPSLLVTIIASF